jgi:hypothetical protein
VTGWDRNRICTDQPLSVRADSERAFEIVRDGSTIRVVADVSLSGTADAFQLDVTMEGRQDDRVVFQREWHPVIPRDGI